jgi:hypothetical protein
MKKTEMIRFWYPGIMVSEHDDRISECGRSYMDVVVPPGAYAFQFYDKVERTGILEDGDVVKDVKNGNYSPTYFPDGKICDLEQAKQREGEGSILVNNMIGNNIDRVCYHRRGGVQRMKESDVVYKYDKE